MDITECWKAIFNQSKPIKPILEQYWRFIENIFNVTPILVKYYLYIENIVNENTILLKYLCYNFFILLYLLTNSQLSNLSDNWGYVFKQTFSLNYAFLFFKRPNYSSRSDNRKSNKLRRKTYYYNVLLFAVSGLNQEIELPLLKWINVICLHVEVDIYLCYKYLSRYVYLNK